MSESDSIVTPTTPTARRMSGNQPTYPLASLLWSARSSTSQWVVLPLILMAVGLFRWAAGLWGYSGFQSPPMHGDYEAQRHWMEITTQLPISQWYFHDLEWWGLDYPPLTAYHSWVLGKIGGLINPSWFALHTSRGLDDPTMKVFMRATVIISEYLVFVPAAVIFVRRLSKLQAVNIWTASIALTAILMQPGSILIDHAHFQYNTVMLGLVLASMSSVLAGRYMWSCVFFVMALGFKQMALYYAPAMYRDCYFGIIRGPILALFLGAIYDKSQGISARPELDGYAAPLPILSHLSYMFDYRAWYYPIIQQSAQVIYRVFPFARGLFEDKVANFWCALNVAIKLRNFDQGLLQKASLLITLASITPPCLIIFFKPRKDLLPLALATSAWGFFLFSFQVHEKSVLLPLMPMTVMLAGRGGLSKGTRSWIAFANVLGAFTMFPLLQRVELRVPYFVLVLLWLYLLGLPPFSFEVYAQHNDGNWIGFGTTLIHTLFYQAMVAWHLGEIFWTPPAPFPDFWVVMNVAVGVSGFGICYLWCLWSLAVESGLLQSSKTEKIKAKAKKVQ
ncbi:ALG8 glycosyltransferase family ALG6 [Botrytis cinerea]